MGPGRPPEAPKKATWGPCTVPGVPAGSCTKPVLVVGVGFVLVFFCDRERRSAGGSPADVHSHPYRRSFVLVLVRTARAQNFKH